MRYIKIFLSLALGFILAACGGGGGDPVGRQVHDPEVHDAVLANQFWLFTDNAWDAAITKRTSQIVGRLPPSAGLPTNSSAE